MCKFLVVMAAILVTSTVSWSGERSEKNETPSSAEQVAALVLEAVVGGDRPAVAELARRDDPDPWIVADELCCQGKFDAAEAFSRAAARPRVQALPAYVVTRRGKQPESDLKRVLAGINAAAQRQDWEEMLHLSESIGIQPVSLVRIRIRFGRGIALEQLNRLEESIGAYSSAAEFALDLGWLEQGQFELLSGRARCAAPLRLGACCRSVGICPPRLRANGGSPETMRKFRTLQEQARNEEGRIQTLRGRLALLDKVALVEAQIDELRADLAAEIITIARMVRQGSPTFRAVRGSFEFDGRGTPERASGSQRLAQFQGEP